MLIGLLIIAAILGDFVNFEIGKHFGQKLFANPNSKIFKQSYLEKTHNYYEKYGGRTIIIARFIPIVRTFAPFVAGMGRMHYGEFIRYNIIGAVAWVVIFTLLGYFFGQLPFVKEHFSWIMIGIIVFSLGQGIVTWNKNNQSPRLTVSVVVAAKRENITHHQHANVGDLSSAHGFHTTTNTMYYVTFQMESGDRMEFQVSGIEYGMLAEGDTGELTFQGTRYLAFER